MSSHALLLEVHLLDDRWHGAGEWPPSPFRLFQALVAGAARGRNISESDKKALKWLETLDAPIIAAPAMRRGQNFTNWVPNNDLDSIDGDPDKIIIKNKKKGPAISFLRVGKKIQPLLINPDTPFLYLWSFDNVDEENAEHIRTIAEHIYQFGRGVDMAFARAEIMDGEKIQLRLEDHRGPIFRPTQGTTSISLRCPQTGSLASLEKRYEAQSKRFKSVYAPSPTKKDPDRVKFSGHIFSKAPPARFHIISYNCPPAYLLFDIRKNNRDANFSPHKLASAAPLVTRLRDAAVQKLETYPDQKLVQKIFVGKNAGETDKAQRITITALPSIGFTHADRAIRRIMVKIPPDCPMAIDDIEWAFSGLEVEKDEIDSETGEVLRDGAILVPAVEHKMLDHYGIGNESKTAQRWRSVTPVALPVRRRRIDPAQRIEQAKAGSERAGEERAAASAVAQALRHVGIINKVDEIRVQREPFEARGEKAELFTFGRFNKHQLWHVEITFSDPLEGPLLIGDGRYMGLGLMAPVLTASRDIFIFEIAKAAQLKADDREAFLTAVRRALMALDRDCNRDGKISPLFSGHEADGSAARSGNHRHIFLAASQNQGRLDRLYVIAPQEADHKTPLRKKDHNRFQKTVSQLKAVRAGRIGIIYLKSIGTPIPDDPILSHSISWQSITPYLSTRHPKSAKNTTSFIKADIIAECLRRNLPVPEVEVMNCTIGPRGALQANIRLDFKVAVQGPILLGRNAHCGGGLFQQYSK